MKMGVLARSLSYDGYGVQTFLMGLLDGFMQAAPEHDFTLFTQTALPPDLRQRWDRFAEVQVRPRGGSAGARLFWDHLAFGAAARRHRMDVLYSSAHIRPAWCPCPVVVGVPDMMYHRFPRDWSLTERLYFRLAAALFLPRAAAVAALSEHTRADILDCTSLPPERVRVVYPGAPQGFTRLPQEVSSQVRLKYALPKPFVLYVGSFHPRKNLELLVQAFEALHERIPHDLVIVGMPIWHADRMTARLRASPAAGRIKPIGFVPASDLVMFYNQADCFVFPSRYEGFGFPVLEALACGCPTITTTASSLPEIAAGAACLVAPEDAPALQNTLLQVLQEEPLRLQMRQAGLERAARFTWLDAAQKTIQLLVDASQSQET
jgi:glycosyltransferase involved in cell wall biosynthesis